MSVVRIGAISVGILAASTWIGSLVCLAGVSGVARRELNAPSRIALFQGVGRLYRLIGTASLLTSIAIALVLSWPLGSRPRTVHAMFVLSIVLVGFTAAGMAQARRMTVARTELLEAPGDPKVAIAVRRGAKLAAALRGAIAVLTLVIVVLGADSVASR
jgi:hypothetical protein